MLGERIKKLRKQKKMTLAALAGEELTKGMLSLIENNKANPSMESLNYIAKQLDVDVSDLLDTVSTEELQETLEKAEMMFNKDLRKTPDKWEQLKGLIAPHLPNLIQGYEAARLLQLYGYALHDLNEQVWEEVIDKAAKLFDEMNISANRAAIAVFRAHSKFAEHDYQGALTIFLQERKEMEAKHPHLEPLTRLDFDYHEATLHFATGDSKTAIEKMEAALEFSKQKKIFYRIDDLYRLAAAEAMMTRKKHKMNAYLKKLKQYGEFADHQASLHFYDLFQIMELITEQKAYEEALTRLDQLLSDANTLEFYAPWFYLEKGKTLYYLGEYEEALNNLQKVEIPAEIHHPFDLSIFYVMDAYKALCYKEMGKKKEALAAIETAVNHFAPILESPFKTFCTETYEKIVYGDVSQ